MAELRNGSMERGPTKTPAGVRAVALPAVVKPDLRVHLARYVAANSSALLFTGSQGGALRRGNFRRAIKWAELKDKIGLPTEFAWHDLRHTGDHLASSSGASTKELVYRMGHKSERAAMIYQHATQQRDREIAASMDRLIRKARKTAADQQAKRRPKKSRKGQAGKPQGGDDAAA